MANGPPVTSWMASLAVDWITSSTRDGSARPGSSTRIWFSPRPYFCTSGSLTPSLSIRSVIVSMEVSRVRASRSRTAEGFIASVDRPSAVVVT